MKAKKKKENLEKAQAWWDRQPSNYQKATTRPGSINQRVITGSK